VTTELDQMHCLHRDDRKTAQGHQTTIWFTERAPVAAAWPGIIHIRNSVTYAGTPAQMMTHGLKKWENGQSTLAQPPPMKTRCIAPTATWLSRNPP